MRIRELMVLQVKSRINQHKADAQISVQTVEGHIRMLALGKEFEMPEGHLLTPERGVPHEVEALDDSAFLLTIAWPKGDR